MPGPFERLFPPEQRRDNASHRPLLNSPLEPKHIRFGGTASGIPTLDDRESGQASLGPDLSTVKPLGRARS